MLLTIHSSTLNTDLFYLWKELDSSLLEHVCTHPQNKSSPLLPRETINNKPAKQHKK